MGLPSELRKLLWVNAVSFVVFIYLGIFVNLYIWQEHHRISDVAWFNLFMFLIWPAAFSASAQLLTRYSIRLLMGLSSAFGAMTFILLTYAKLDNHLLWLAMIAIPAGIMWGCFSASNNLCVSQFGKGKDFAVFFSASNTIVQILNMTVPIVSAIVIQWLGFRGSFLLMLLFVVGMAAVAYVLPPISLKSMEDREWRGLFQVKTLFEEPGMRWLVPSSVAGGMFMQFQALFAMLITFMVSPDKLTVAFLNSLYTLSALAALYMYRKLDWPGRKWMLVSMLLSAFGFAAILMKIPALLIVSNLLTTVGYFYFTNVWASGQFRCISRHYGMWQPRLLIWREAAVCLARTLMLLLILGVKDFQGGYFYGLMVVALSSLALGYLSDKKMEGDSIV